MLMRCKKETFIVLLLCITLYLKTAFIYKMPILILLVNNGFLHSDKYLSINSCFSNRLLDWHISSVYVVYIVRDSVVHCLSVSVFAIFCF